MQNDHESLEEKTKYFKLAWIVVLSASLYFFYEFIQMNIFNAINTELRATYQLNGEQLGQFFSMYFYANALFLFPAGNLLDRFSTKKLLLFALGICVIGAFLFAVSPYYFLAAGGRFLEGAGASFCFLGCIRIASRWFAPARMAFVTGVIVTMAMLGGLVAQAPFTILMEHLGNYRHALLVNVSLGVVIFIVMALVIKDYPPDAHETASRDAETLKSMGLSSAMKMVALNPQNWLGGLYTALINLPVFILGGLWGMLYLTKVHNFSTEQASYATTIFFVGVILGAPAFGWLSDKMGRRVMPMILGAVMSLVVVLILFYMPGLSISAVTFLFFLIGFVTSSQVLTYPTIAELNPIYLTGTAVSIDSICIMVSGFLIPPVFGWLMDIGGTQKMIMGVVDYSKADFQRAMLVIPIAFILGLIIAFFIKETYCRQQK